MPTGALVGAILVALVGIGIYFEPDLLASTIVAGCGLGSLLILLIGRSHRSKSIAVQRELQQLDQKIAAAQSRWVLEEIRKAERKADRRKARQALPSLVPRLDEKEGAPH
jgi:hypothetical protein